MSDNTSSVPFISNRARNVMKLVFGLLLDGCRESEWITFYRVYDDCFDFTLGIRKGEDRLSIQRMVSIERIDRMIMTDEDCAQVMVEEMFRMLRSDPRYGQS